MLRLWYVGESLFVNMCVVVDLLELKLRGVDVFWHVYVCVCCVYRCVYLGCSWGWLSLVGVGLWCVYILCVYACVACIVCIMYICMPICVCLCACVYCADCVYYVCVYICRVVVGFG